MKTERLERQREDPYYVGSSTAPLASGGYDDVDVDSIPIVQLSFDLNPGATASPPPRREPTPPPVHIDIDGEMPEGFDYPAASAPSVATTPANPPSEEIPIAESKATEGTITKVVKKKRKDGSASKPKKKKDKPVAEV